LHTLWLVMSYTMPTNSPKRFWSFLRIVYCLGLVLEPHMSIYPRGRLGLLHARCCFGNIWRYLFNGQSFHANLTLTWFFLARKIFTSKSKEFRIFPVDYVFSYAIFIKGVYKILDYRIFVHSVQTLLSLIYFIYQKRINMSLYFNII